jgi:hypothetical protein
MVASASTKGHVDQIIKYVGKDAKRFENLVTVYLEGPYRITQRAARMLSYCVEDQPELIIPHLKKILDHLEKANIPDAVKRNTMRLLQFIEVPGKYRGRIVTKCFEYLENKKEPVAVKVFSMSVLSKLTEEEPELRRELRILLEDQLPYAKPAFLSRAIKTLKELK